MKLVPLTIILLLPFFATQVWAKTARESIKNLSWINKRARTPNIVTHQTFYSKANQTKVGFYIYLPPHYQTNKNKRYPVIYSLHGMGGDEARNIEQAEILHKAIQDKTVPSAIYVMANGIKASGYYDSYDRSLMIETMIIKELIPHIDATYRTIADKKGRAIQGFSMGGAGTTRLGLKHPHLFSSICPFSGLGISDITELPKPGTPKRQIKIKRYDLIHKMLGDDLSYWKAHMGKEIVENNAEKIRGKLGIHITFGEKERPEQQAAYFQGLLKKLNIEYELVTHPHGHVWGDDQHVIDAFKFHFKHFTLTQE